MLATARSAAAVGTSARMVEVEVEISGGGLPGVVMVGLPDASVRESRERVRSALLHNGWDLPPRRTTISLAPADLKKVGSVYDLPIAVGLVAASGKLEAPRLSRYALFGELSLDGRLRPVPGVLPMTLAAREAGLEGVIVPAANATEAGLVEGVRAIAVSTLPEAVAFLAGTRDLAPVRVDLESLLEAPNGRDPDFADVRGQEPAKRAMLIAAAGGHNLLMIGPPGTGKTMLARRLPGILPRLLPEESLEATAVHSVAGFLKEDRGVVKRRPFRDPHHSISDAGLVGGGSIPRPGEISLAHHGVLFLDELPEFRRSVLEVLRQPLEEGRVVIGRAQASAAFPARFMLVAAMNPCPCGYMTHPKRPCHCNPAQIQRYLGRVSGPLLDRIDIHVEVAPLTPLELERCAEGEGTASLAARVAEARERQRARYLAAVNGSRPEALCNAALSGKAIEAHCALDRECKRLLTAAMEQLGLSVRAYTRIRKVARTIADLEESDPIRPEHLAEAIQYRTLDRQLF